MNKDTMIVLVVLGGLFLLSRRSITSAPGGVTSIPCGAPGSDPIMCWLQGLIGGGGGSAGTPVPQGVECVDQFGQPYVIPNGPCPT